MRQLIMRRNDRRFFQSYKFLKNGQICAKNGKFRTKIQTSCKSVHIKGRAIFRPKIFFVAHPVFLIVKYVASKVKKNDLSNRIRDK